jgi:hypothetical protein
MGTTLTGLTPATTFDALLKTTDNQPLTTSLKVITDGLGNNSAFSLSTTSASITGTLAVSSTLTASNFSGTFNGTFNGTFSGTSSNTNTGDETNATIKSKLGFATTSVDGYLTSTDWTTFNNKVATTRSISTTAPLSGGGDLSANRTLSISQANTSTNGFLSSTDWNTFNGKQNALTNPVTGTGTTNYIPKLTGASTIGNSQIFDNGTNVGIGTTSPSNKLSVVGSGYFTGGLVTDGSLYAGTTLSVSSDCTFGSYGDNEYLLSLYRSTGSAYLNGSLTINNENFQFIVNSGGLSIGSFSVVSNSILGATNITGSGKLSIANIGASGTLNVGSTTTATKRLELTADNNGAAENNTLRFVNTDTTILANEVIGKIEFYSNDASSPGASVKAYISSGATTTSPNGYLDFATDQLTGTPSVRQRIQADGKVLIGSTTDNTSGNLVQVTGGLDYNITIQNRASNNYTLVLTDKGKFLTQTASTTSALTIPTNASVAFPIGTQIWIIQNGTGVLTISGDTGVTLNTRSVSRQPFGQYAEVKLTKTATDTWYLTGDLKA